MITIRQNVQNHRRSDQAKIAPFTYL